MLLDYMKDAKGFEKMATSSSRFALFGELVGAATKGAIFVSVGFGLPATVAVGKARSACK